MSSETLPDRPISGLDRDIELAKARSVIFDLLHALYSCGEEYRSHIAAERAETFMSATNYLGVAQTALTTAAPSWRQQVAHAAKTLRARAEAVEDGIIWNDPEWIERLAIKAPDGAGMAVVGPYVVNVGETLDLAPVDTRWFGTFTPEAGRALADVFEGKGSLAALAQALLFRPGQKAVDDEALP